MSLKLKVVFIGDSFVGKTAVMRRFLGEMFDPTFIMTPSGESLKRQKLFVNNHDVELELCYVFVFKPGFVALHIGTDDFVTERYHKTATYVAHYLDAPGNERYRTDAAYYMNNAKVVVLIFDVTNRQSYENIDNWLRVIPPSPEQKPQTVIIGNKTDINTQGVKTEKEHNTKQRVVKTEEAEHKAKNNDSLYFETSAKQNDKEYFKQIFIQITEHVLNNSPGLNNSESMTNSERSQHGMNQPWYKKCILL